MNQRQDHTVIVIEHTLFRMMMFYVHKIRRNIQLWTKMRNKSTIDVSFDLLTYIIHKNKPTANFISLHSISFRLVDEYNVKQYRVKSKGNLRC